MCPHWVSYRWFLGCTRLPGALPQPVQSFVSGAVICDPFRVWIKAYFKVNCTNSYLIRIAK